MSQSESNTENKTSSRICKIKEIIREMFEARQYNDIRNDGRGISATKKNGENIHAFSNEILEKFETKAIRLYSSIMKEKNLKHCIVICEDSAKSRSTQLVHDLHELGFQLEVFPVSSLMFNITKHRLVPKVVKTSKTESAMLRKEYGNKLPKMLKNDPLCMFYNFLSKDIIRATRPDGVINYYMVK